MGIQFDRRISLGHILSMAGMLVAAIMAYSALVSGQHEQSRRLDKVEQRSDQQAERLRAAENVIAGQTSDLRNIQVGIGRIEAALERLNQRP